MRRSGTDAGVPSSPGAREIDAMLAGPGDFRDETLARLRALIRKVDPKIVEEVKWKKPSNPAGVPVWSHDGIVCTAAWLKGRARLTFPIGAELEDPKGVFNACLEAGSMRAIDFREGDRIDGLAIAALLRQSIRRNEAAVKARGSAPTKRPRPSRGR